LLDELVGSSEAGSRLLDDRAALPILVAEARGHYPTLVFRHTRSRNPKRSEDL
jgi:hypothetical protein